MGAIPPPLVTSFPDHFAGATSPAIIQGLGQRVLYTDGLGSPLREVTVKLDDPFASGSPLDFSVSSSEVSVVGLLSELGDAQRGGRIEMRNREPFTITAVEPHYVAGTVRLILAQS